MGTRFSARHGYHEREQEISVREDAPEGPATCHSSDR